MKMPEKKPEPAKKKPLPKPLSLSKLIGPSFIILALGLGSGEVILWPYLAANYGVGIAWGAVLGITFQFFMNMEIERYALVRGESVFVGLAKKWGWTPWWFIVSTFIGFGLPGIIAASAKVFSGLVGVEDFKWIAIAFLIVIGLMLSVGKTVYGMMERTTSLIIMICVPFIFILAFILAEPFHWADLAKGLVGIGDGYRWLPKDIAFATFFAAFAYSGAAGNLNLTQSIYVKEKGYGMGAYAQKISGLFRQKGGAQTVILEGQQFEMNASNLNRFNKWWKTINTEHLLVFWLVGSISMLLLIILSYATAFGTDTAAEGIEFVLTQGTIISGVLGPWVGKLFLLAVAIMLFQTQLGVMDSTSRIMAENLAIRYSKKRLSIKIPLAKMYAGFLWAQIAFGIVLFLLDITEPRLLIVLGAVLNAFAMFVHVGLVNWMNHSELPKEVQAAKWRKLVMTLIFLVFGVFSGYTIWDKLF